MKRRQPSCSNVWRFWSYYITGTDQWPDLLIYYECAINCINFDMSVSLSAWTPKQRGEFVVDSGRHYLPRYRLWALRLPCSQRAYLFINCSKPFLLSSIKSSSNIPSSDLIKDGSCFLNAFPGNGGTTIYKIVKHVIDHEKLTRKWWQYSTVTQSLFVI